MNVAHLAATAAGDSAFGVPQGWPTAVAATVGGLGLVFCVVFYKVRKRVMLSRRVRWDVENEYGRVIA